MSVRHAQAPKKAERNLPKTGEGQKFTPIHGLAGLHSKVITIVIEFILWSVQTKACLPTSCTQKNLAIILFQYVIRNWGVLLLSLIMDLRLWTKNIIHTLGCSFSSSRSCAQAWFLPIGEMFSAAGITSSHRLCVAVRTSKFYIDCNLLALAISPSCAFFSSRISREVLLPRFNRMTSKRDPITHYEPLTCHCGGMHCSHICIVQEYRTSMMNISCEYDYCRSGPLDDMKSNGFHWSSAGWQGMNDATPLIWMHFAPTTA